MVVYFGVLLVCVAFRFVKFDWFALVVVVSLGFAC